MNNGKKCNPPPNELLLLLFFIKNYCTNELSDLIISFRCDASHDVKNENISLVFSYNIYI